MSDGSVEIVVHQDFETKIKSPVLEHLVSHETDPRVKEKKVLIKVKIEEVQSKAAKHFARYTELKGDDDKLDGITGTLASIAMAISIAGVLTFYAPLIYVTAVCTIGNVVGTNRSKTKNYKERYHKDELTHKQLTDLAREMSAVLAKNNLTAEQYVAYIEETNARIALITDFAAPI
jgi:hypothetical protein